MKSFTAQNHWHNGTPNIGVMQDGGESKDTERLTKTMDFYERKNYLGQYNKMVPGRMLQK